MADAIDTTEGQSSFVSAREDAWHALGTTLADTFTAEQAMEVGHLGGWKVRKVPAVALLEDGTPLPMPGRYATVRTNPIKRDQVDFLGDVGESYTPIQNEEHAALLNALVDESGAHFETAGAIEGGRRVFITMKLPGHLLIGGVDQVDTYLAAVNSHDGSSAFTLLDTPVRIVCKNTLNAAFANHGHMIKVRHTSGAHPAIVQQAREALELTFKHIDGLQEEAERMIQTTLTQNRFEEIITKEFGAAPDAHVSLITRRENMIDELAGLFSDAYTQKGIRNTVWAGFNAMTEWFDHFSPTRGDDRDTSRAIKAAFDPSFKNRARSLMLAEVK